MSELTIPADLLPADPRFGSGPSRIRREVVESLAAPGSVLGTSHRKAPVKDLVHSIRTGLAELYRLPEGYQVALGNGGATLFWSMAACSLVKHRSANGVYGSFTRKFATTLQKAPFLADPAIFEAPAGRLALPEASYAADSYAWAQNETSTGVAAPVRRPADVDDSALVLIDATSAAGGIDADISQADAYYFSPQKNFASDGGLWVSFLSPAAIERSAELTSSARWVPDILNLTLALDNSLKDQTLNTPAIATLMMLEAQVRWLLAHGGMAGAAQRSRTSSDILYGWAEANPLTSAFVRDPALRSPVVVTIDLDAGIDSATLCGIARDNGIVDIDPYRGLGRNQIRVGTFSSVDPEDVRALVACLDWILERMPGLGA